MYRWKYITPDGFDDLFMNSDGEYLTGLWFEGSRDVAKHITVCEEKELPAFRQVSEWLDIYFSGKNPDFMPQYQLTFIVPNLFIAACFFIDTSLCYHLYLA